MLPEIFLSVGLGLEGGDSLFLVWKFEENEEIRGIFSTWVRVFFDTMDTMRKHDEQDRVFSGSEKKRNALKALQRVTKRKRKDRANGPGDEVERNGRGKNLCGTAVTLGGTMLEWEWVKGEVPNGECKVQNEIKPD